MKIQSRLIIYEKLVNFECIEIRLVKYGMFYKIVFVLGTGVTHIIIPTVPLYTFIFKITLLLMTLSFFLSLSDFIPSIKECVFISLVVPTLTVPCHPPVNKSKICLSVILVVSLSINDPPKHPQLW